MPIKCKIIFGGRGSAPDPTWAAHSAPSGLLAGGEGLVPPSPRIPPFAWPWTNTQLFFKQFQHSSEKLDQNSQPVLVSRYMYRLHI